VAPEVRLPGCGGRLSRSRTAGATGRRCRLRWRCSCFVSRAVGSRGLRSRPRAAALRAPGAEPNGVTFANRLPDDTAFNILTYMYYYDGGGVAAGDVNNDGLPDLYFTSNVGPNRLYLNKGDYRFEDVTEGAGVADPTAGRPASPWPTSTGRLRRYLRVRRGLSHEAWAQCCSTSTTGRHLHRPHQGVRPRLRRLIYPGRVLRL